MEKKLRKLNWLLGWKSNLSIENKLLIYKVIIKPIWTFGVQLWGCASNSNIEILQHFQNKTLKQILNFPRYVSNWVIHQDLNIPFIKDEILTFSIKYKNRIQNHPNELARDLLQNNTHRRLKRVYPFDST